MVTQTYFCATNWAQKNLVPSWTHMSISWALEKPKLWTKCIKLWQPTEIVSFHKLVAMNSLSLSLVVFFFSFFLIHVFAKAYNKELYLCVFSCYFYLSTSLQIMFLKVVFFKTSTQFFLCFIKEHCCQACKFSFFSFSLFLQAKHVCPWFFFIFVFYFFLSFLCSIFSFLETNGKNPLQKQTNTT